MNYRNAWPIVHIHRILLGVEVLSPYMDFGCRIESNVDDKLANTSNEPKTKIQIKKIHGSEIYTNMVKKYSTCINMNFFSSQILEDKNSKKYSYIYLYI